MPRPLRSADIAELRAFCAAVELGSLGRAARLLQVSQPAVSKRLRALEALAGAQLLERTPRGVKPTPAGQRLHAEARRLLLHADAVDQLMAGLRDELAPVRLAASHTAAEFMLPGLLDAYAAQGEDRSTVEVLIANSSVVRDLVRDGRVDFGLASLAPDDGRRDLLQAIPCGGDEVVVAVPRDHPWAALAEIPVAEFTASSLVMRDPRANSRKTVEAALAVRGLLLGAPLAEAGTTAAVRSLAVGRQAPALLSSLAVPDDDPDLVRRHVEGLRFRRRFAVLVASEGTLSAQARRLVAWLRTAAPITSG